MNLEEEKSNKNKNMNVEIKLDADDLAERVLDSFTYEGKSLRQWVEVLKNYELGYSKVDEPMTLDEAIKHCKEKSDCTECGKEHTQLEAWLKELRVLRSMQPKRGEWEYNEYGEAHCSCCGEIAYYEEYGPQLFDFCPFCGADMRGEKE